MGLSLYEVVFKLATHAFMPLEHFRVGFRWERISREVLREDITFRIDDIPLVYCVLQKACMLIRVHQKLYCLPSYKTEW